MFAKTLTAVSIALALAAAAPAAAVDRLDGDNNPLPGHGLVAQPTFAVGAGVFAAANGTARPAQPGDNWDRCTRADPHSCLH